MKNEFIENNKVALVVIDLQQGIVNRNSIYTEYL